MGAAKIRAAEGRTLEDIGNARDMAGPCEVGKEGDVVAVEVVEIVGESEAALGGEATENILDVGARRLFADAASPTELGERGCGVMAGRAKHAQVVVALDLARELARALVVV